MSRLTKLSKQLVHKLLGTRRKKAARRTARTLALEQLDRREVLAGDGLTVVLDPGHGIGNVRGGSSGVESKVPERDLTLDMARRTKGVLDQWGFKTTLTRNDDNDVDFYTRSRTAKDAGADYFLSMHLDGLANGQRGTTAYVRRDGNVNRDEDVKFADFVRGSTLTSFTKPNDLGTRVKNASEVPIGVLDDAVFGNTAKDHPVKSALLEIESLGNVDVDRFFNNADANLREMNRQHVAVRIAVGIWQAKLAQFDNAPLAAPKTLTATANSSTEVTLNWSDTQRETGYRVYSRAGGLLATVSPNTTQFVVRNLAAGQQHAFRVEAFNANTSATTGWANVTTPSQAVVAPTGFTATATSPTSVELRWNDVSGETGYRVFNQANQRLANLGANSTSFTVKGLTGGRSYSFRVEAFNGGSMASTGWTSVTTPFAPVAKPTWFTASATSNSRVQLKWGDASNATGYQIWIARNGQTSLLATLGANTKSFLTGSLARNQSYGFLVTAFNPSSVAHTNWQSVTIR